MGAQSTTPEQRVEAGTRKPAKFSALSAVIFSVYRIHFSPSTGDNIFSSLSTPWAKEDLQNSPVLLQVLSPNAQKRKSHFPGSMEMRCQSPQGARGADVHYKRGCQKPCSWGTEREPERWETCLNRIPKAAAPISKLI